MINKYKLYEGLFDDDEELFQTDDDALNTFEDINIKSSLEIVLKLIGDVYFNKQSFFWDDNKPIEYKIYAEYDDNNIIFYYKAKSGKKYIDNIQFDKLNIEYLQKIINSLSELGFQYVFLFLNVKYYNDNRTNKDIDFKDIQFCSYNLTHINIHNLIVDFPHQRTHKFSQYIHGYIVNTMSVSFYFCNITDTILINNVYDLTLVSCTNIQDFSFIKNISNSFTIQYNSANTLPACNNLQGIPKNSYTLNIEYLEDNNHYNNIQNIQTLEGIHNNLKEIKLETKEYPWYILHNISLEGLTEDLLKKFKFIAWRFRGADLPVNMQLGPYNFQVKARKWHPTKPQYKTILKTKNWFMDCYLAQPHKPYVEPEYDLENKDIKKQLVKVNKINQQREDAKEDLEKMVNLLKKTIKENDVLYGYVWTLFIRKIKDNGIQYTIQKRWSFDHNFETFENFIRKQLLNDNMNWKLNSKTGTLLKDIVCKPVQEERQKILEKRKKQEKKQKELEKLQKAIDKQKNKIKTSEQDVQQEKPVQTNSNIKIIDYSDKAIAVIGDTYSIKDQLKELGARWNSGLTINGKKTKGWILSKRKKSDVENLI